MSYQKTWQKRCDVKYCVNAYNQLVTFFPTPKDPNLFKQWQQAVHCTETILPQNGRICEKHFSPKDIMEFKCLKKGTEGSNSSNHVGNENLKLRVPIHGAIPSRFDDEIAEFCKRIELKTEKEAPLNSLFIINSVENSIVQSIEATKSDSEMIISVPEEQSLLSVPIRQIVESEDIKPNLTEFFPQAEENLTSNQKTIEYIDSDEFDLSEIEFKQEENSIPKQLVRPVQTMKPKIPSEIESSIQIIKIRSMKDTFFDKMYNGLIEPRLPNRAWNIHNCEYPQKGIIFAEVAELIPDGRIPPILKKSVFFDENFNVRIYFYGKLFSNVEYDPPKGINDVEEFLRQIDSFKICEGGPQLTELSNSRFAFRDEGIYKWRHNNCELRLERGQVCKNCSLLCKTVGQRNIDLSTESHLPTKRVKMDYSKFLKSNSSRDHKN